MIDHGRVIIAGRLPLFRLNEYVEDYTGDRSMPQMIIKAGTARHGTVRIDQSTGTHQLACGPGLAIDRIEASIPWTDLSRICRALYMLAAAYSSWDLVCTDRSRGRVLAGSRARCCL
jgi:hypothetical protein